MFQVIQASLAFAQLTVAELLSFLNAVYARMKDNPAFTVNLPFDMAIFKAAIDSFTSAVDAALDGSKKAMAERNRQREVVIKMLRQLAHYVEAASKDDVSVFLSSGFEVRPTGRTKTPPLSQFIRKIDELRQRRSFRSSSGRSMQATSRVNCLYRLCLFRMLTAMKYAGRPQTPAARNQRGRFTRLERRNGRLRPQI
ncbi:MAG: hypothetical protein DMG15_23100 [Acidobacteria bacterium]|nr:MAG: hypothetical protein DMG15_23100 [Acidobacteriota bacterium]